MGRMKFFLRLLCLLLLGLSARAADFLPGVKRILVLGDSITASGQYVDLFETFLLTEFRDCKFEVINCGLPSETVSGLSEDGHAGGAFPRPDLHERLDRVLALTKPDLVFACYGMNCGIYLPFDEVRFAKYREGIEKLHTKVKAAGADIIHLTPAVFDSVPLKGHVFPADAVKNGQQYEGYDEVLTRYGEWLMAQKAKGWRVVDTHKAMRTVLDTKREKDPTYKFAPDGVHPNADGHRAMAESLIQELAPDRLEKFRTWLDTAGATKEGKAFLGAVHQRGRVLGDAYLTTAGHKRPGMNKGLPVVEAEAKALELSAKIEAYILPMKE